VSQAGSVSEVVGIVRQAGFGAPLAVTDLIPSKLAPVATTVVVSIGDPEAGASAVMAGAGGAT